MASNLKPQQSPVLVREKLGQGNQMIIDRLMCGGTVTSRNCPSFPVSFRGLLASLQARQQLGVANTRTLNTVRKYNGFIYPLARYEISRFPIRFIPCADFMPNVILKKTD